MSKIEREYKRVLSPYNKYIKPIISLIDKDIYNSEIFGLRKEAEAFKKPAFLLKSDKRQAIQISNFYYFLLMNMVRTPFYWTHNYRHEGYIPASSYEYYYVTDRAEEALHGLPKKYRSVIEKRGTTKEYLRTPIGYNTAMTGDDKFIDNDPAHLNIVPKRGKSAQVRHLIRDVEAGGLLHRYNLDEIRDIFIEILKNSKFEVFNRNPRGKAKGSNIIADEMVQVAKRKDRNIKINKEVKELKQQREESMKRTRARAHASAAAMREQLKAAKEAVNKARTVKELTAANKLLSEAIKAKAAAVEAGKDAYKSKKIYDTWIETRLKKAKD